MKNEKKIFSLLPWLFTGLVAVLIFSSCKKEESLQQDKNKDTLRVTTNAVSNITVSSAEVSANIIPNDNIEITARGICWGEVPTPSLNDNYIEEKPITGTVLSTISGLQSGTLYYVRAYATTSEGIVYGNEISFRTAYQIGDVGPSGGLVFYDKGNNDDGWRYLEAAPNDLENTYAWGCGGKGIEGADNTDIGGGKQNTTDILAGCATKGIAADMCNTYVLGDYSDWFLPSKDELNLMYENLNNQSLGDFASAFYLSSSEANDQQVWAQLFETGFQTNTFGKEILTNVRPIRAFE